MLRCERIHVGPDAIDLADGTGTSQVAIHWIKNVGSGNLYFSHAPDCEWPVNLAPREKSPALTVGATDSLYLWADMKESTPNVEVSMEWT